VNRDNPLQNVIARFKPGDEVTLTIFRDGKEQTVKLKLEEAPQTTE
jgi:S1-C subfamily serine protease